MDNREITDEQQTRRSKTVCITEEVGKQLYGGRSRQEIGVRFTKESKESSASHLHLFPLQ